MEKIREVFGRNVKARRLELGLSVSAVAKASGVSENSVRRIESGQCDYYMNTLSAIAETLDMSLPELFKE